jgi:hypothetical protein
LAVLLFGWWIARSRTLRNSSGRAVLIAGLGSLGLGYLAWWIWEHRDWEDGKRDFAAVVAVEMPFLWIQFCMLAFLIVRYYLYNDHRPDGTDRPAGPGRMHWNNNLLACLLAVATVIPVVLAGHHALFLPFMFVCWCLAFLAWGTLGLVSWSYRRCFYRPI